MNSWQCRWMPRMLSGEKLVHFSSQSDKFSFLPLSVSGCSGVAINVYLKPMLAVQQINEPLPAEFSDTAIKSQ